MAQVRFKAKGIAPCPECKTEKNLAVVSERSSEDTIDVWVRCDCGFDPFSSSGRIETVWGLDECSGAEAVCEYQKLMRQRAMVMRTCNYCLKVDIRDDHECNPNKESIWRD